MCTCIELVEQKNTIKVAHYTLKFFLNPAEKYLIMIDIMAIKKYTSQIGECAILEKNHVFNSVNVNKKLRWIRTHNMRFTSQIL